MSIAAAFGAIFAVLLVASPSANAAANPFEMAEMSNEKT